MLVFIAFFSRLSLPSNILNGWVTDILTSNRVATAAQLNYWNTENTKFPIKELSGMMDMLLWNMSEVHLKSKTIGFQNRQVHQNSQGHISSMCVLSWPLLFLFIVRHILRCEETKNWREELVDKRFTSIEPEIGIRRIATNKYHDKLQKVGLYLSMYKAKWRRSVMKYDDEYIIN
jgi:hypothetical protein